MKDFTLWAPCRPPAMPATDGRFVRIEPFSCSEHEHGLFKALAGSENAALWRYIPVDVPESAEALAQFLLHCAEHPKHNWRTHVFRCPTSGEVLGMASYMRIRAEHGSAEVGCVIFSKALQRTPAATEAMYLMAKYLFEDLGYRRYEWKCHNSNTASRRAAERLGFTFEGVFRNDMVMKGENRDTAWYSMIDDEWPQLGQAFECWLSADNFDKDGTQIRSLTEVRSTLVR